MIARARGGDKNGIYASKANTARKEVQGRSSIRNRVDERQRKRQLSEHSALKKLP